MFFYRRKRVYLMSEKGKIRFISVKRQKNCKKTGKDMEDHKYYSVWLFWQLLSWQQFINLFYKNLKRMPIDILQFWQMKTQHIDGQNYCRKKMKKVVDILYTAMVRQSTSLKERNENITSKLVLLLKRMKKLLDISCQM